MSYSPLGIRLAAASLRIWDVCAVILGLMLAARWSLPAFESAGIRNFLSLELELRYILPVALFLLAWGFLYQTAGLYSHKSIVEPRSGFRAIILANLTGALLLFAGAVIGNIDASRLTFAAFLWTATTILLIAPRLILAGLLRRRNGSSKNRRSFLIVGTNARSRRMAQSLLADRLQRHKFIGYVDIAPAEITGDASDTSGSHFLALQDLPEFLRKTPVDDVIVCLPLKSCYDETMEVIRWCEEQGVTAHVCADIFETRMTHSRIRYFSDQSVITVHSNDMHGPAAHLKRGMDVLLATALLVLLSPLIAAAALAVSLTSPGPVFFLQERVGLNKKIFRVIKFRTMVTDAEIQQAALETINEANGPAFKIQEDPRVTTIGKFLRKYSIDELPQLINVVRGEMSLVGPRPLPLRDYSGFGEDWHRRRLSVPPGITGLWQVKDRRHQSFDNWMKLDIQYIDQWSIWLDVKILLLTLPAVLRGSGH